MSATAYTRNVKMVDMDTHKTVGVTCTACIAQDVAFMVGIVTGEDMRTYPDIWDACKNMQSAYEMGDDRTAYESYLGIELVRC